MGSLPGPYLADLCVTLLKASPNIGLSTFGA
jgi:hypothetical protein